MAREITIAEVDQAEAALAAAKKGKDPERKQQAAESLQELRTAYRLQEEAAGRRTGLVGGDATPEG